MREMSLKQWKLEAISLFGEDPKNWKFVCPACGNISSANDFIRLGKSADRSYQECIGRAIPKQSSEVPTGCNWCAYGLFGTMGKGVTVVLTSGKMVSVFAFAPPTDEDVQRASEDKQKRDAERETIRSESRAFHDLMLKNGR